MTGAPGAGAAGGSGHELGALRVVDLSSGLGGAYCSKLFADAGADVITVEPAAGHPLRRATTSGPVPEGETAALFAYLKAGQRSVFAAGDSAGALLDGADIVIVDDARAPAIAHDHPLAVVVAITPFGLEGPYAGRPASELTVQAESGGLSIRGGADQVPFQAGGQITEWVAGAYAAAAALAAARGAAASGRGELIDVSWAEVANLTCTLFNDLFDSLRGAPDLTGIPPRSLETPSIEPTADGWVGFNTNSRQQFEDFLVLIERPDMLEDPSWAGLATRVERFEEWNAIVRDWTTKHTTAEIVERAVELRIPVSPIGNAPGLLALDHAVARGVFVPDPDGAFRMPRRPWTVDGEDPPLPGRVPALGEHSGAVEPRPSGVAPRRPPTDAPPTPLPLQGLSVVDLTAWWAGPSASAMLAALGADVVHIESPTRPDGMRLAAGALFFGQPQWWERSHFFLAINTNKRGLAIRLDTPEGREAVLELIATADVVIENFTPRVIEGFDLGWDVVQRINPQAVMVRLPAFGLSGPWRDRPGFAQTMEQATGLAWVTGHLDDQPRIQRGPCDPNGGMHAVFAALVGLARRDRTGAGCLIEASMLESALAVAAEQIVEHTAYGVELGRMGNRSHTAAPQGVYPCAGDEQWLALTVADDEQWAGLGRALGNPAWCADPGLATLAGRQAAHDRIDAELTAWAAGMKVEDAVARLIAEGVPAGAAADARRAREHPQFVARGFHERPDHPLLGALATPTLPYRFASIPTWIRTPAPVIGEHNHEVLTSIGYDAERIADLEARGIVGEKPAGF